MRHITSEEGFELLEQLRILEVDGYKLERLKANCLVAMKLSPGDTADS